jgi:hypothetical protein
MSVTDFEDTQGLHIDDNCKYQYKFSKVGEGYVSIKGVVLNICIYFEGSAQFACLRVQRYSYVFICILRIILYNFIYIYMHVIINFALAILDAKKTVKR